MITKKEKMKKYRINTYGLLDHIFDVQVKKWYGWVTIKSFHADISMNGMIIENILYCKMQAKGLLEKLEED